MGRGLTRRPARQHSDLTAPALSAPDLSARADRAVPVFRGFVLALLAVDGVIVAVVSALYLPARLGGFPFPISALFAGVMNLALVWAASYWTTSLRIAALPVWTFLATAVLAMFGGPGGDIIFGSNDLGGFAVLVLMAAGALPAAWWLYWRPPV